MLYDGFVVIDTRQSPLGEYGDYNAESAYDTYAGPGGAPSGTYGPNLPTGSSGGSSGPLPGLGGAGWGGGSQSGSSKTGGGVGQYINPDTIAAGTNLLGGIFGMIGASKAAKGPTAANVKAVCGRKPLFNIKGKKDAYFACAERVANPQPVTARQEPPPSSNKGLIIGLIVAVVLIGIIITVILVMKKKQKAVAA